MPLNPSLEIMKRMREQEINRYKTKVACYMIVLIDDKVLLMKRQNSGFHDGEYTVPSGHMDIGETPLEGAIRETFEETDLIVKEAEFSCVIHRIVENIPNDDYMDFFFICKSYEGVVKNKEPDKCSEIILVETYQLPEILMVPYVELALNNMLLDTNLKYLTIKEVI
ncbi:NUDIX domain-containing protein [Candidatus Dependentiae bacterium]|nr:NUDIX domain-containing protein [Candidatus Dependentiae bacterium]